MIAQFSTLEKKVRLDQHFTVGKRTLNTLSIKKVEKIIFSNCVNRAIINLQRTVERKPSAGVEHFLANTIDTQVNSIHAQHLSFPTCKHFKFF